MMLIQTHFLEALGPKTFVHSSHTKFQSSHPKILLKWVQSNVTYFSTWVP